MRATAPDGKPILRFDRRRVASGAAHFASQSSSPSLPGFNLRQLTDWMSEHIAEEFSLDRLAAQAGLSKFR